MCAERCVVSGHELCVLKEALSAVMYCVCAKTNVNVGSYELCVQRQMLMSTVMNCVCRESCCQQSRTVCAETNVNVNKSRTVCAETNVNVNSHELCVCRGKC